MATFIGVDPGKSGCLAFYDDDYENGYKFFDWPKDGNTRTYFDSIIKYMDANVSNIKLAALERVHALPKQGVSSCFSFGKNFGQWLTFLDMIHVPYITVLPQVWQKNLLSKADGVDTKAQSFIAANRLFPLADLVGLRGGKLHGRSDALLLAYYACRVTIDKKTL